MVAVRSAHLNTAGEFALDEWIASLGLPNPQSCERLAATWRYCEQQTQNHPNAPLLLWRGLEMVEILSTLSMDNDSMRAALLFPLVDAGIVQEETLTEAFGKGITYLVHGVRDMDAIRQLKATQKRFDGLRTGRQRAPHAVGDGGGFPLRGDQAGGAYRPPA